MVGTSSLCTKGSFNLAMYLRVDLVLRVGVKTMGIAYLHFDINTDSPVKQGTPNNSALLSVIEKARLLGKEGG